MQFDSLMNIIKKVQKKHTAFGMRLSEAEALGRWEVAVGELIAKHSRAVRVQDSVLWVEVEHPIWRSELHYRKQQILDILNGKTISENKKLSASTHILKDIYYIDPRPNRSRFSFKKEPSFTSPSQK